MYKNSVRPINMIEVFFFVVKHGDKLKIHESKIDFG